MRIGVYLMHQFQRPELRLFICSTLEQNEEHMMKYCAFGEPEDSLVGLCELGRSVWRRCCEELE